MDVWTDGRTPNSMWCRMPGTRVLPQVFSFNYTILLITTRWPPMGPKQQAVGICHFDKTWAWAWARAKERATALEENDSEWASHHGSHHLVGTGVSWLCACVFVSIHQTERGDKQMRKSFFLSFIFFDSTNKPGTNAPTTFNRALDDVGFGSVMVPAAAVFAQRFAKFIRSCSVVV